MPSTVYKGDLSEISFGHESGIVLEDGMGSNNLRIVAHTKDSIADTSVIIFTGGLAGLPVNDQRLSNSIGRSQQRNRRYYK